MDEINLTNLKLQIENLLHSRTQLAEENQSLRRRLAKAIQERAALLNKKEVATKKLKSLITQIREEMS